MTFSQAVCPVLGPTKEGFKMEKIFFSVIIFMSFFINNCCFGADKTTTTAGKPLTVEEFIGTDVAYLEPTMFPNFYKNSSENPTCADYLMDGDTDYSLNMNNGTGKDRWTATKELGAYVPLRTGSSSIQLNKNEYQFIPGLTGTISSPKDYRNITKILFTWTVRLEGSKIIVPVWPNICSPHHGTSYQEFPEGQLKTQLYIKGVDKTYPSGVYNSGDGYVPVGQIAEMTVPSAGTGSISNPGDPTITGSYVLLPADFADEELPEGGVEFQVRWYNETSMKIKSPEKQRNLIATVFPVTS